MEVEVSALEMRTFLAASGRELLVQKDYTVLATDEIDAFERVDDNHRTTWSNFDWFAIMDDGIIGDASAFSNVMGKYVVEGRVTARVRRIEARNADKNYVEYVHGVGPGTGELKRHTCNPRLLGDYADGLRLHSMTPVYFSREVLNRYASEPSRYKVTVEATGALLGSPVWRDLDSQAAIEFEALLGPTSNDPSALTAPTITLTKSLVDGMDPAPLKKYLGRK